MAAAPETSAEYIKHHLTNLTFGQHPDGHWGFAHSMQEAAEMGFWAINVDSMLFSVGLGVLFLWGFRKAARTATSGVPGGWQNFVEWVVEFIDESVRGSFSGKNPLVGPLALTIFIWIFLMNLMDLIPVDWLPAFAGLLGVGQLRLDFPVVEQMSGLREGQLNRITLGDAVARIQDMLPTPITPEQIDNYLDDAQWPYLYSILHMQDFLSCHFMPTNHECEKNLH